MQNLHSSLKLTPVVARSSKKGILSSDGEQNVARNCRFLSTLSHSLGLDPEAGMLKYLASEVLKTTQFQSNVARSLDW